MSSVEVLRKGAQAWSLIELPILSPRASPVFCQLDRNNLILLGGFSPPREQDHYMHKDGIIFNQNTGEVKKIDADHNGLLVDEGGKEFHYGESGMEFMNCINSQAYMEEPGKILALVTQDSRYTDTKLLCFKEANYNNAITILKTLFA